ncbi:hypothetical protein HDU93_007972 [Gonapodya sp. JEL0774]|nr:hypothetical protein HDU93_007972 [Gonapodya sp. JEL0774]
MSLYLTHISPFTTMFHDRHDYTIFVAVRDRCMFEPVIENLVPLRAHSIKLLVGKDYPSFSKLVNDCVRRCETDIVIFASHRVRPTLADVDSLLTRIDDGYGLATGYRFAFFGFRKDLIRKIGLFDERYEGGGYEDIDMIQRLWEADIAYYEAEDTEYHASPSTWIIPSPDGSKRKAQLFHEAKWDVNWFTGTVQRRLGEDVNMVHHDTPCTRAQFKSWNQSVLKDFSLWTNSMIFLPPTEIFSGKNILVFGGTGTVGYFILETLSLAHKVTVVSRGALRQMRAKRDHGNSHFILGDITDNDSIRHIIRTVAPEHIVIVASTKRYNRIDADPLEAIKVNSQGVSNILRFVEEELPSTLSSVVLVSTDEACNPSSVFGYSKALAERMFVQCAERLTTRSQLYTLAAPPRVVVVRMPDTLYARGGILDILEKDASNPNFLRLSYSDANATMFVSQPFDCTRILAYAILRGVSGDIIIPQHLASARICDLATVVGEGCGKCVDETGLKYGEKLHRELMNEYERRHVVNIGSSYIAIRLNSIPHTTDCDIRRFQSQHVVVSCENLRHYVEISGVLGTLARARG